MATVLVPPTIVHLAPRDPSPLSLSLLDDARPHGEQAHHQLQAPRDDVLTLVRQPVETSAITPAPAPVLRPNPQKQQQQPSGQQPFPVPPPPTTTITTTTRAKRGRGAVSGAMDLAATSIPTARLISHEGGQGWHVVYDVHVRPMGRLGGWDVHRRYSHFLELHTALLATYPHAHPSPPPLPPKRWFGGSSPAFIERRRAALETYLEGLLANEALRKSKEVRIFLGLGGAFSPAPSSSNNTVRRSASAPASMSCLQEEERGGLFQFPYAGGSFVGEGRGGKKKAANVKGGWTDVMVVSKADEKQEAGKQVENVGPPASRGFCSVM